MFGTILITAVTVMQIYVFWRAYTVPFIKQNISGKLLIAIGIFLWVCFYIGRVYGRGDSGALMQYLELSGMTWMATLFITTVFLFMLDILTGFGFFMPKLAPVLRGFVLAGGGIISMLALFQGLRTPVVNDYNVYLENLPQKMDGMVVVGLSDLHLGSLVGAGWLNKLVTKVQEQQADLIVLLGDIFEGRSQSHEELQPALNRISAPLGVWAVSGNHDSFRRNSAGITMMKKAGIQILRNSWQEIIPGLVIAGVDNLSDRNRNDSGNSQISRALDGRPPGATIFLSHKPILTNIAAAAGADLMLSGHTHGGQVWPFGYLVKRAYPLLTGRYEIEDMTLIISRGAGTWGPRMRLWQPGEILRITLHRKKE